MNGNQLEGVWQNDVIEKKGKVNYNLVTCYYLNGTKYEGEWKDNKKHGQGNCRNHS